MNWMRLEAAKRIAHLGSGRSESSDEEAQAFASRFNQARYRERVEAAARRVAGAVRKARRQMLRAAEVEKARAHLETLGISTAEGYPFEVVGVISDHSGYISPEDNKPGGLFPSNAGRDCLQAYVCDGQGNLIAIKLLPHSTGTPPPGLPVGHSPTILCTCGRKHTLSDYWLARLAGRQERAVTLPCYCGREWTFTAGWRDAGSDKLITLDYRLTREDLLPPWQPTVADL